MKGAIFLDRDGTINEDSGYIGSPDNIVIIDGALDAIKLANSAGVKVVLISNQSGVGRGYFTRMDVEAVNKRLNDILERGCARIDAFYYCPHSPDEGCGCRKPETGLVERAAADLGIDISSSYIVGDKATDVELGKRSGAKTVMVMTGHGEKEKDRLISPPDFVAKNLLSAMNWILKDILDSCGKE